jgi:hypothetical protein
VLTAPLVAALEFAALFGFEFPPSSPHPVKETAINNPANHVLLINLFPMMLSPYLNLSQT